MSHKRIYHTIIQKEPLTTGWSEDKKYCVATADGTKYLLRISPKDQYQQKQSLFSIMEILAELDIPMCRPIEFGICTEGVYSIQSWINGVDLQTVLPLSAKPLLSESKQYDLGLQAGKIIRKIHSVPIAAPSESWADKFNGEIAFTIQQYQEQGLKFEGDKYILNYIENNSYLLKNRPQCFCHSDYTIINMMFEDNKLYIIDFERFEIGDPWNEFNCICWSAMASAYFTTGQIQGYFQGDPPIEFFRLLALYSSVLLLSLRASWAVVSDYGSEVTLKLSQKLLEWFNHMENPVPTWYLKGQFPHN